MNFSDELCAALRLSDGVLLVVDAVEVRVVMGFVGVGRLRGWGGGATT